VTSVVKDVVIGGSLPGGANLAFHVFFAAAGISALVVRGRRYQEAVGIACAGAIVVYIALLFTRLR
jgi:hypothetical protein